MRYNTHVRCCLYFEKFKYEYEINAIVNILIVYIYIFFYLFQNMCQILNKLIKSINPLLFAWWHGSYGKLLHSLDSKFICISVWKLPLVIYNVNLYMEWSRQYHITIFLHFNKTTGEQTSSFMRRKIDKRWQLFIWCFYNIYHITRQSVFNLTTR